MRAIKANGVKPDTWNTEACYTEEGQRIAYVELECGAIYFNDVDRMVDGVIMNCNANRLDVGSAYMDGRYERPHFDDPFEYFALRDEMEQLAKSVNAVKKWLFETPSWGGLKGMASVRFILFKRECEDIGIEDQDIEPLFAYFGGVK
jgi:hypothetical protein